MSMTGAPPLVWPLVLSIFCKRTLVARALFGALTSGTTLSPCSSGRAPESRREGSDTRRAMGAGWNSATLAPRRSRAIVSKYATCVPLTSRCRNSTQSTSQKPSCLILRWNASGIRSTTNISRGGRAAETSTEG